MWVHTSRADDAPLLVPPSPPLQVEQLLGMPEPSLVEYVTDLLANKTGPAKVLEELHPVLDADTETFVIKLFRMVIYECAKSSANL